MALSVEQQIIMDCVRHAFGQNGMVRSAEQLDWDAASHFAIRQGVAPLIYPGLEATPLATPESFRNHIRIEYLATRLKRQVWIWPTFRRVVNALQNHGLEPIVLKGAALAHLVYPEPDSRTFRDIDLLLPAEQLEQADHTLRELGFWTDDSKPGYQHHLRPHISPDGRLVVELHHHLTHGAHTEVINLEQFRAQSRLEIIGGVRVRVLSPTDTLIHLCIHQAYGHYYRGYPLRNLTDILALTTSSDEQPDWDSVLEIARHSRTEGAVYWSLRLARDWLTAPVPDFVLSALAPPLLTRRLLAQLVQPQYILGDQAPPWGNGRLHEVLMELSFDGGCSLRQQLRYVLRILFPPPGAVGHLSEDVTGSRLRYGTYLVRPERIAKAMAGLFGLLARLPRRKVTPSARTAPPSHRIDRRSIRSLLTGRWTRTPVDTSLERNGAGAGQRHARLSARGVAVVEEGAHDRQ